MRNRSEITSKFVSDSLTSIKNDNKSWTIIKNQRITIMDYTICPSGNLKVQQKIKIEKL